MAPNIGVYASVEAPWIDNGPLGLPFQSCLPDGVYYLKWLESPKYGMRWHLLTDGLTHKKTDPGSIRHACMIHPANYPDDVIGCIGLGPAYMTAANPSGRPQVSFSSRQTVREFQSALLDYGFEHTIRIETNIGVPWI